MKTHVCTFRLLDSERGNEEGVMQKEMSAQVFSESIFLSSPLMITTLLTMLTTNRARMRCIRLERSKAEANVLSAFMVVREPMEGVTRPSFPRADVACFRLQYLECYEGNKEGNSSRYWKQRGAAARSGSWRRPYREISI